MADKLHISHTGLTKVMSAVISTGGSNIADILLSKDPTRRHRNKIRKQNAATIMEKNLEPIHKSESNRHVLLWDGKILKNIEHVGTSKEVIAIFLAATDKKSDVILQINPVGQKHSLTSEQTKIILYTLDKWKIERDLVIGLAFDTTSIKAGIRSGVAVSLEQAFGTKLLLLACLHHVLELLC